MSCRAGSLIIIILCRKNNNGNDNSHHTIIMKVKMVFHLISDIFFKYYFHENFITLFIMGKKYIFMHKCFVHVCENTQKRYIVFQMNTGNVFFYIFYET